jgi:hypothetical protein
MSCSSRLLLLLLLLSTVGCDSLSQSPSAPLARMTAPSFETQAVARASDGRYPLVLGASWTYEGIERTRERLSGQADFGLSTKRRFTRVATAVRRADFPGVEYLVVENVVTFEGTNPGPFQSLQYLREDAAALYSYPDLGGVSGLALAGSSTPAPRRQETILLRYPVHVGSVWSEAPTYPGSDMEGSTFTVEAMEPIQTPMGVQPAARVRAHSESMLGARQPDLTWFGRSGVLRTWKRSVSPFTKPPDEYGERERTTEEHLVAVTGL